MSDIADQELNRRNLGALETQAIYDQLAPIQTGMEIQQDQSSYKLKFCGDPCMG